jgi:hypothetical protein
VTITCIGLASLLCLVLGATALAIGTTRPATRTTTVQRTWTNTTTFGWSGAAAASDIYPDGQVQSPQPVFLRLLSDITVTADVTASGATRAASSGPLTLRATLGDDTGWSRTWALDRSVASAGDTVHLSAPLQLGNLLMETGWNQISTGVLSPVTLTLSVDSGQAASPSAQTKFSLDRLLFKPLGPLTTSTGGSVPAATHTTAAVRLAGHSVSVAHLRTDGAVLVGVGLIVAAVAALADRRRRRSRRSRRSRTVAGASVRAGVPGQRSPQEDEAEEESSLLV